MKILYFHQHFSLPTGAHPGRSHCFAAALANLGHMVTLVSGFYSGGDGGTISRFKLWSRGNFLCGYVTNQFYCKYSNHFRRLRRLFSFFVYSISAVIFSLRARADVVFATSTPLTVALPMLVAKLLWGSRCLFEARDKWPDALVALDAISLHTARGMAFLEQMAIFSSENTCGLSPGLVGGFREVGASKKGLHLIPNFSNAEIVMAHMRRGIPLLRTSEKETLAIYFGTFGVANGLSFLVEVARIISCLEANLKIVLVGDGGEKGELLARAGMHRLQNIMFIDPIPRVRLAEILNEVDIAIHCLQNKLTIFDSASPNKLFEALSAGLPIVTNWKGWLARRIVEVGAGFAVEASDPLAFAQRLAILASDKTRRAEMGRMAKLLARLEFSSCLQVRQFTGLVEGGVGLSFCDG